ncbi:hypothetical protein IHE45_14G066700, partial [Dioscorea alata]
IPNTYEPTKPLVMVAIHNSIKLTSTNYLSWKTHNPTYQTSLRQDKLLFGALVGTLTPTLIPLITRSKNSLEAWTILSNTYSRPSRGHIKQLKDYLKQITK